MTKLKISIFDENDNELVHTAYCLSYSRYQFAALAEKIIEDIISMISSAVRISLCKTTATGKDNTKKSLW